MAQSKLKSFSKRTSWVVLFVALFLILLLINLPISTLNSLLKEQNIELENLEGDFSQARFSGILIDKKTYPLSCRYNRQSGLTYQLDCDAPLKVSATVKVGILSQLNLEIKDAVIEGSLENLNSWMILANIPRGISANVHFDIKSLIINQSKLLHVDLVGQAEQVSFFDNPLIEHVDIKTIKQEPPVTIDIRSDGATKLFLESSIQGNQYVTKGTIRGRELQNYSMILNYFGKRTQNNEWSIYLSGKLLP